MLEELESLCKTVSADYDHALRTVKENRESYKQAKREVTIAEASQQILQEAAQQVQEQAHDQIATLVSRCLKAVFDDPYEFKITFEKKRGRTEARLSFVRDGMEISPLRASGGGVVDVASFALRLACLLLGRPPRRRVLISDEAFKGVDRENRVRVRELLSTLSSEMGVQMIQTTHSKGLIIGSVVAIEGATDEKDRAQGMESKPNRGSHSRMGHKKVPRNGGDRLMERRSNTR